jgi:hypothetical protein
MLCGRFPFKGKETKELYKQIVSAQYFFPDNVPISQDAKSFISKILKANP